jgi:hypothetical protein
MPDMLETFTHKFFGWLKAEAYHHVNPDGSIDISPEYIARVIAASPFADNETGIPQMVRISEKGLVR